MKADVFTMTNIKGPRRRDGFYLYELQVHTAKGPAIYGIYPKEIKDVTENRAELTVLVEALKKLKRNYELDIYTESVHIASALEKGWLKEWQDNGWVNARGKELANWDLWQEMAELLNGSSIRVHVGECHSRTKWMRFELEQKEAEEKKKEKQDGR